MLPKAARLRAWLCLALIVQSAVSQSFDVVKRDGNLTPTTIPASSSSAPKETNSARIDSDGKVPKEKGGESLSSTSSGTITDAPTSTHRPTSTLPLTIATDGPLDNDTLFNATIPDGQLPLPPRLTPGWGVAGVIMLVTGVIYTLVGIKNRWIHTFFSTAYMTALGVSVLIVYVMTVPVSNALQGGYVVAVVMSSCAVGAAAMFFKELTEGFGCALGGFCISMWLLCLVPGGLLHAVASKAIFIAVFTIAGFAFYFSRWTRDWALIFMISFGGATITILGIDCFSRAGLKEFWAYVWDINDNLFPLGANTYPVTKGIRVETAAVIIIFLVGIISQIKLWRIVREKREKRAAERAEDQRNLENEEENVGRHIEDLNARERRQWERAYGDGTSYSITDSRATDFGDAGSEKKLRPSYVESKQRTSGEVIEMADMSESESSRNGVDGLMANEDNGEGKITVRVAADDVPETTTDIEAERLDEKAPSSVEANVPTDGKWYSKGATAGKRHTQSHTMTEVPEVIPLPFTVPEAADSASEGDRSSIATFADDVEATAAEPLKHRSLVKRLSHGSATLLRSFSQRSGRTGGVGGDVASDAGESTKELVLEKTRRPDDEGGSLAATIDDESVSGGNLHSITGDDELRNIHEGDETNRRSIEIDAQLGRKGDTTRHSVKSTKPKTRSSPTSTAASSPVVGISEPNEDTTTERRDTLPTSEDKTAELGVEPCADLTPPEASERAKSVTTASSTPASLTKDRLPRPLSKAAMSYRTNEWAKHLSNAECPEPDALQATLGRAKKEAKKSTEKAAPVNVEELQQTAKDGAPAPAVKRSTSQASDMGNNIHVAKRSSKQDLPPSTRLVTPSSSTGLEMSVEQRAPAALLRKSSGLRHSTSNFMPIAEENPLQAVDSPIVRDEASEQQQPASNNSSAIVLDSSPATVLGRNPTSGVVSYSSPQTLIGQREMFLRSKSQGSLLSSTPEPIFAHQGPGSDAGSLFNYPMYAAAFNVADPDDVPLSQRKEIMRQSSLMSLSHSPSQSAKASSRPTSGFESSESIVFNSHQPKRVSTLPTQAVREAQLASFRQSVQQELRSGTPIIVPSGRETPFGPSTLLGGGREAEVQRNIEMQRSVLMGQKEAEAQRREVQKQEREHADRAFDERMRNGDMLDAHREAMRKMQKGAR
uniref:TM7S3/TM198-like domain-containing protein n=1 Tax=Photinus pyralis TaxID=7054 RepID=A0A1Y1NGV4_PHOPY